MEFDLFYFLGGLFGFIVVLAWLTIEDTDA